MIILPAIDLVGGKAVRLFQGDYEKMTVYEEDPLRTVAQFEAARATWLHLVDLEGAKSGGTENRAAIARIVKNTRLFVEVGGGVRTLQTIEQYLALGVKRVILGTQAVTDVDFAKKAAARFGEQVAAGADIRDGFVAVRGWTEKSTLSCEAFCQNMQDAGIGTLICTDISRDGAMRGTNLALYQMLSERFRMRIIASGGVSSLSDVRALSNMGLYGAIIGKAYYTGAVDLKAAIAMGSEDAK